MFLVCPKEYHALYESDGVPGAKLNTSALCLNNNTQLKRWLKCRTLPTSGNKAQLEKRYTFPFSIVEVLVNVLIVIVRLFAFQDY